MAWTVYSVWSAISDWPAYEMCGEFPDRETARRSGLKMACLSGVRYVTVVDPDHVVTADYDRYTNRWREYKPPLTPAA